MASKDNIAVSERAKIQQSHQTTQVRGSVKDRLGSKVLEVEEIPVHDLRRKLFHSCQHTPQQASQADERHSRALVREDKREGAEINGSFSCRRKWNKTRMSCGPFGCNRRNSIDRWPTWPEIKRPVLGGIGTGADPGHPDGERREEKRAGT